jgi:hypothetical protein
MRGKPEVDGDLEVAVLPMMVAGRLEDDGGGHDAVGSAEVESSTQDAVAG